MSLTHERLREIKLRLSGADIKELIAFAEETLGPAPAPPVLVSNVREDGTRESVELTPRQIRRRQKEAQ